jgi:hypothetical protein
LWQFDTFDLFFPKCPHHILFLFFKKNPKNKTKQNKTKQKTKKKKEKYAGVAEPPHTGWASHLVWPGMAGHPLE